MKILVSLHHVCHAIRKVEIQLLFTFHTNYSQIWCEPKSLRTVVLRSASQNCHPDMKSHEMSKVDYHIHKLPPQSQTTT